MRPSLSNKKTKASFDVFKQLGFHGVVQDGEELTIDDMC